MDAYEAELLALFVLSPYVKVEMRDMYRQYLQRSGSYNTVSKDLTCTVLNQVQFIFFAIFQRFGLEKDARQPYLHIRSIT